MNKAILIALAASAAVAGISAPAVAREGYARAEFGRGRYTLWTGNPGTALYLADCLTGGGAVPLP